MHLFKKVYNLDPMAPRARRLANNPGRSPGSKSRRHLAHNRRRTPSSERRASTTRRRGRVAMRSRASSMSLRRGASASRTRDRSRRPAARSRHASPFWQSTSCAASPRCQRRAFARRGSQQDPHAGFRRIDADTAMDDSRTSSESSIWPGPRAHSGLRGRAGHSARRRRSGTY